MQACPQYNLNLQLFNQNANFTFFDEFEFLYYMINRLEKRMRDWYALVFRAFYVPGLEKRSQWQGMAEELYRAGDYKEAIIYFEQYFKWDKTRVTFNLQYIHCLVLAGRKNEALAITRTFRDKEEYADKIFGQGSNFCIVEPLIFTVSSDDETSEIISRLGSYSPVNPPVDTWHERKVFVFWSGYTFKLIRILRQLIYAHSGNGLGYQVIWLDPDNVRSYIEVPHFFDQLSLAHQSDYIRVQVIHKYGGIWLDADTLVVKSLDALFDVVEDEGCFFIEGKLGVTINAVFGAKRDTL